ncbi:hypothetical protein [Skermanella stibiiresistens]|nr:hypothetical protein [Skermanella stibiiresistens]
MKLMTETPYQDAAKTTPASGVVVVLRFEGPSFVNHELSLRYLRELEQFGEALGELASYLWLKDNPDRRKRPKGLLSAMDLKLGRITRNCVTVELTSPCQAGQMPLPLIGDEMRKAAIRTCEIFNALDTSVERLPDASFDALTKFAHFGTRFDHGDTVTVQVKGDTSARYDGAKRLRLERALREIEVEDFEVLASIPDFEGSKGYFGFETVDGRVTRAPLPSHGDAAAILARVLSKPDEFCARIFGKAEVSRVTGKIIKILSIGKVVECPASHLSGDPEEPPIWGTLPIPGEGVDAKIDKALVNLIMSYEEQLYRDAM